MVSSFREFQPAAVRTVYRRYIAPDVPKLTRNRKKNTRDKTTLLQKIAMIIRPCFSAANRLLCDISRDLARGRRHEIPEAIPAPIDPFSGGGPRWERDYVRRPFRAVGVF